MEPTDHIDVWEEESWTFHQGRHVDYEPHIYVDYCEYLDGVHYPGQYCPHEDEEDPGWTVQTK